MKLNSKIKWVFLILGLIVVGAIWIWVIGDFSGKETTKVELKIKSASESPMISEKPILAFLRNEEITLTGLEVNELDLHYIESALERYPFTSNADVHLSYDGVLVMEIEEREPIVRIVPQVGNSYYLDIGGNEFPLSDLYTADVVVATGNIDKAMSNKIYTLAEYVHESKFWNSTIEQIFVTDAGDISFFTKLGDHQVIFGDSDRLKGKFSKLEKFYREALTKVGWDEYRIINVKYKDEVVCK